VATPQPDVETIRSPDGAIEVEVLPDAGARIHRLRVFGADLLSAPDDPAAHLADPFFSGAYVMAPWCNRIDPGPVRVGNRSVALVPNFPGGSAIHGQVYARRWDRTGPGSFRIRGGEDGWPWAYEAGLAVAVANRSVTIALTLANRSPDPMPGGLGLHPWFRRPVEVAIHGDSVFPSNADTPALPVPVAGPLDVRRIGALTPGVDATWTDLADPPVELKWPHLGLRATMHVDAPVVYIVAASVTQADAIAVEPQTHAPQGLRRLLAGEPGALAMVDPGATLRLVIQLAFRRDAD